MLMENITKMKSDVDWMTIQDEKMALSWVGFVAISEARVSQTQHRSFSSTFIS